jgi:hypothetical protein
MQHEAIICIMRIRITMGTHMAKVKVENNGLMWIGTITLSM